MRLAALFLVLLLLGCRRDLSAVARIQASGLLRVAVDPAFPPFESVDENGDIVGFDADLAAALAEALGVDVHFVTTGYDALYDALTMERADIILSALYPDPSRTAAFVFSRPYFNAGDVLVVSADSAIEDVDDLAGATVACVYGAAGHMIALDWTTSLDPPPLLLTAETPLTLTARLKEGTADAVVVDHVSALMTSDRGGDVRILTPPLTDQPYVIAARHDDADLIAELNIILQRLEEDGVLDTFVDRWMRS